MKEAVIVSTARTPIGKAFRGAFNNTKFPMPSSTRSNAPALKGVKSMT